jgi:acetyl/propionyl-CoA carboxylase alpha subunit
MTLRSSVGSGVSWEEAYGYSRAVRVDEGQVLLVVESMKMQLEVRAPVGKRIAEVLVEAGQVLDGVAIMATLEP